MCIAPMTVGDSGRTETRNERQPTMTTATMLLAFLITLQGANAPKHDAPAAPKCETVGPRIDGIRVTICDGRAVAFTDANGVTLIPGNY